jgi:hypothetical protein
MQPRSACGNFDRGKVRVTTTGNKYLPLLRYLVASLKEQEYLRVTVEEFEELVGPLPPRARRERYWTTSSVAHRNWRCCGFDCATVPARARGGRSNGAAAQLRSQQIGQEALDGAAGGGPAAVRVVTPLPAIAPSANPQWRFRRPRWLTRRTRLQRISVRLVHAPYGRRTGQW